MQMQWYSPPPQRVRRTRDNSSLIAALCLLLVGVVLLGIAGYFLNDTLTFLKHATASTTATIISCPLDYDAEDPQGTCPPTLQFVTADGKTVTITDPVEGDYQLNETLPVDYDPANPQDARIASDMHFWFLPRLLGGLGALFFVIGLGMGIAALVQRSRRTTWNQRRGWA